MGAEPGGLASCRRLRTGLGTLLAVEAAAPSPEQAETALEAAFAAMAAVEQRMHPSRDGSDLARLNAMTAHPSPPIAVHRSTWELLKLAHRLHELSGGIFDPCLPCRQGRLGDVELLPHFNVRCHAPVRLDFGGFAKGYAVDQAIEALVRHGCSAGLVNAGGDLRVFGPRAETFLLRESAGQLRPVRLSNAALAVSDTHESRRPPEHVGYYSRTRTASDPDAVVRSAAVIASQAVLADALTKCALLCTAQQLWEMIRDLTDSNMTPSTMAALCTMPIEIHVHCTDCFGDIPGMRPQ